MHRNIVLSSTALVYYVVSVFALVQFESGSLAAAILLFGIPAYALARFSAAPTAVLATVVAFGAGVGLLLEGVAHIYGIWYFIGVEELRLFGVVPLEVLLIAIVQTLFLTLLYELIFDDGEYNQSHARTRFTAIAVFSFGVLLLLALHQYVLKTIFFSHSYIWILVVLIASSVAALLVQKKFTQRLLLKLTVFISIASVPLICSLAVAVANSHKVFAYTHDYLYTFSLFNTVVPIEELLLTLAFPLFVATFYELYLDDGV